MDNDHDDVVSSQILHMVALFKVTSLFFLGGS